MWESFRRAEEEWGTKAMSRKTLSSLLPLPPRLEIPADGALPMEVLPGGAGETHDLDESIQHVHSPGERKRDS